jgi:hypothetical protein
MANKTTTLQVTQATHDLIMQIKLSRHLDSADAVIRALLPLVKRKGAGENPQPSCQIGFHPDSPFDGCGAGSLEAPRKTEENKK